MFNVFNANNKLENSIQSEYIIDLASDRQH